MGELQLEISRPFRLGGFATGDYMCKCMTCGGEFTGDKRAMTCLPCVADRINAARSEAQPSGTEPRPYPFASPGLKYSEAFVFEGGSLTVNTTGYGAANGAGWLCFLEKELEWERGDNGQDYRIANLDRSELIALRDKLNEVFPALTFTASLSDASPSSGDE